MPGPHFNSKRLKAAKNVRAEFAPGSVPRVGTRLFTLRLLPRTVEKNCNCRIPLPPPAPAATVITVNMGLYTPTAMSLNKMRDNNDYNGTGGTIGFITAYNVAVGDTISFTDSGGVAYTGTVTAVDATKAGGRNNEITLSPDPTNMGNVTNVTITQS